ncbi:helix-turn-helix domain-containing protein [Streptomyces alkaliphilus]|uniref:helix-turn-helix domain-containing protein n=1 Tax=Streptomyces alkaliphilus TaxID=1472722 RepID=UPI00117CA638|nr:helix-turn-helix transcriptional regulator [Streptomyces alkaliphilus]MQS08683.1 helix-turn-helix domain-containing protein [Streptomyces alkaliphilus]
MPAEPHPGPEQLLLGSLLRAWREASGLSPAQAAHRAATHPSTLLRTENGQTPPDPDLLTRLLRLYRPDPEDRRKAERLLRTAAADPWWHPYRDVMPAGLQDTLALESHASLIRIWSPGLVPDLLRTPDYARALHRALNPHEPPAPADRAVELLEQRTRRLTHPERPAGPARIWALLTHSALHTAVGDRRVMTAQHAHLRAAADQRHITVQVLPAGAPAHPLSGHGPLRLIRSRLPEAGDVVVMTALDGTRRSDDPEIVSRYLMALDLACLTAMNVRNSRALLPGPTRSSVHRSKENLP